MISVTQEIGMVLEMYPRDETKCLEAIKRIGLGQFISQASVNHDYSAFAHIVGHYKAEQFRGNL